MITPMSLWLFVYSLAQLGSYLAPVLVVALAAIGIVTLNVKRVDQEEDRKARRRAGRTGR